MSAVAAPLGRLRERTATVPAWALAVAGLGALVLLSAWLRSRAMLAGFWIDEGLSVGIADRPLHEIPGILRLDGSPPLYYMLLSVWMDVAGRGEGDTHALSLGFALLCVPAAWVAGRLLWGAREGWIAALVAALLPYLTYYAQETRMYALVALLSLIVSAAFALAFVHRRRAALPVLAVALLAAIYSHNWALFLGAGSVLVLAGLVWSAPAAERRGLLRDGLLAYGPVGLLYLPWVPTLLFQAANTGAPWAERPGLAQAVNGLNQLLGGPEPTVAALLGAGAGVVAVLGGAGAGWAARTPAARATAAVLGLGLAALALAWLASQASPAWANRYFAVFVGPVILVLAVGFARAGRLGVVALVLASFFWFDGRERELHAKSNAQQVAAVYNARLFPDDLVVVTHPEQQAVMHYYLPGGLRWADALGPVDDPRVFDWRGALGRLAAAEPIDIAEPLVADLEEGQRLLLVQPMIRSGQWRAPWTALVRRRAAEWERLLDADRRLRRVDSKPTVGLRRPPRGVRGVLYVRR